MSFYERQQDDALVRVTPMLERIGDWREYLNGNLAQDQVAIIEQHARTGRPLGSPAFIRILEKQTGIDLTLKRPGRKPSNS